MVAPVRTPLTVQPKVSWVPSGTGAANVAERAMRAGSIMPLLWTNRHRPAASVHLTLYIGTRSIGGHDQPVAGADVPHPDRPGRRAAARLRRDPGGQPAVLRPGGAPPRYPL